MNQSMIKEASKSIDAKLEVFASNYYGVSFTPALLKSILSLEIEDKEWLVKQYEEEISFNTKPDFSNLY
jgi:hypothetical protein